MSVAQTGPSPDLWQLAKASLSVSTVRTLDRASTGKKDVALATLKVAEEKRQISLKKRWRVKRSSGHGDIIVRDVLEKIIHWIRRFRDVGDQIVQYDPGHAALPWAAFRFVLQIAINDTELDRSIVEDLEMIARLMARCRHFERLYPAGPSPVHDELKNVLVKLYAAILKFLAMAISFFEEATARRLLKAPFRTTHEGDRKEILDAETEVLKVAGLIDTERLYNLETQIIRLRDISSATQKVVGEEQYLFVLKWLSQVPYTHHHNNQRDSRLAGTGKWLLQHPQIRTWDSSSSSSLLLLHGIPGCGKTALCSIVIDKYLDDLAKASGMPPLAYFYCNSSPSEPERRAAVAIMRSLTRQLVVSRSPQPSIHSAALASYEQRREAAKIDGFQLEKLKIAECVELILAALENNPATIIIDALDEIEEPYQLTEALESIIQRSRNVLKVFATSRDSPKILAMLASHDMIRITSDQNKADCEAFAAQSVENAISSQKLLQGQVAQEQKQQIINHLIAGASEMILWIKLELQRLCALEHEADLMTTLTSPAISTLNELYEEAYGHISRTGEVAQKIAECSLAWVLHSQEPLKSKTFLTAVAASIRRASPTVEAILSICQAFLVLDIQSDVFRFAHQSAQQFVQLQPMFTSGHAHNLLAMSCIWLCEDLPEEDLTELTPSQRIYDYAALYWGHHCSAALSLHGPTDLVSTISRFIFDGNEPSMCATAWMDNVRAAFQSLSFEHPQKMAMELVSSAKCSPLLPICTFGLLDILESHHWPIDVDWNERNDYGQTPLYAAACLGHTKVVAFLLRQGVDGGIECGRLGSALHCAAYRGHVGVVRVLLEHGVDLKSGSRFDDAVHAACQGDQEDALVAIIDQKTVITDHAEYQSVTEAVCEAGFLQAMEILEAHPLCPVAGLTKSKTMAKKIIRNGKVANLKYLIRKSGMVDIAFPGMVALAALHGHEAMATYLLDQGCTIDEAGESGRPLRCASLSGSSSVCRLLLDRGADVDENDRFGSGLHAAAMKGHQHVVALLLDAGADVNVRGGHFGTPLQAAAYHGHRDVASLLVGAGANVHQPGFAKDAFHAAAEGGQHDVIQLLLTLGSAPWEPLPDYRPQFLEGLLPTRNLLRESSPSRRRQVHTSYDLGDSISRPVCIDNQPEGDDFVNYVSTEVNARPYVRIISDKWPDNNDFDARDYLLETAAGLGHLETVRTILAQRFSLHLSGHDIQQALVTGSAHGHHEVVNELLVHVGGDDKTLEKALEKAIEYNNVEVARAFLLRNDLAHDRLRLFQVALAATSPDHELMVQAVLDMAMQQLSTDEMNTLLIKSLTPAVKADHVHLVKACISRFDKLPQESIFGAFQDACESGSTNAVQYIYASTPLVQLTKSTFTDCVRLAVEEGHTEVVEYLLPFLRKRGKPRYLRNMTLVAAGCGYLGILQTVLREAERIGAGQLPLQQGLNVAAEHGHKRICEWLLPKVAHPFRPVRSVAWADISVDRGSNGRVSHFAQRLLLAGAKKKKEDLFRRRAAEQLQSSWNRDLDAGILEGEGQHLHILESCILGFKRTVREDAEESLMTFSLNRSSRWRKGNLRDQEATLQCLLQIAPSSAGLFQDELICAAAQICPPHLVSLMLEKGANAKARCGKFSALHYALSRELLCFPVMEALLLKRAGMDVLEDELQALLFRSMSFFQMHTGDPEYHEDLFAKTDTLEDLFTTGPGAVVQYLLRRLPNATVAGNGGAVLLQCAAATGLAEFTKLLLARRADPNVVGSYYGTALQAAARFEHAEVASILLEAGAEPNVQGGRHHTALRAAVLAKSLEVVNVLLAAGADTELSGGRERDATPLQLAIDSQCIEIAQALIAAGADVNGHRETRQHLLIQACASGDIPLLNVLLKAGADVQARGHRLPHRASVDAEGGSGVHAAIHAERMDVMELLLAKGFDLCADFGEFDPPIVFAARKGNDDVLALIMASQPDVSTETMLQALMSAVRGDKPHAIELLVSHRPSVIDESNARSLLRSACQYCCPNSVEVVLEILASHGLLDIACTALLEDLPDCKAGVLEMLMEYVPGDVNGLKSRT